jgi:cbb3-type cytochrome oxidase subunit 3
MKMGKNDETRDNDMSENKELAVLVVLAIIIVAGIYYAFDLAGSSPLAWAMSHPVISGFIATALFCFTIQLGVRNLSRALGYSLFFACFVAIALWMSSMTNEIQNSVNERRYECRIEGGTLEHFGERGWVCIKPKKGE